MDNYCPKCGKPTNTDGKCPDWNCNTWKSNPVLPQQILPLEETEYISYLSPIRNKINEIIDVINDMRK